MDYDVERVRASFPALDDGTAYFDGPGGSQVPLVVARTIADALTSGLSNRGTVTASERRADEVVTGARAAVALCGVVGVAAGLVVAKAHLSPRALGQGRPTRAGVVTVEG